MSYRLRKFKLSGEQEKSQGELPLIKVGDIVKLVFELDEPESDKEGNLVHAERMWVKITSVYGETLKGDLDNDPLYLSTVKSGDEVDFSRENIFDVWRD